MKIGVLTISSKNDGGIYQYILSLLEAFNFIDAKFDFIQIRNETIPKILKKDILIKSKKNNLILKFKRLIHILTGLKLGNLVPYWNLRDIDLIISPIITLLPYHLKKPYIVTIHDFQHEYYPQFFTLCEKISRKIVYKTGQKADIIVCESEHVKRDVIKFLKVPAEKIKVLPSPPPSYIREVKIKKEKLREVKAKYNLPERYLFYPAQFWYHKNHLNLLESINLIKQKYNEKIQLILVGSKKNNFENVMKKIRYLDIEEQVKYLGYIPEEDMPYLYKCATMLVMPTLFESVSLPIWEAFCLGVPVVSSNVCALPEQVGDAGLLFDPHNIEDMADKIYKVWVDENLRKDLVQRGYERVKNMTLENYAKQWEIIIEEALNKHVRISL